jgi:eukaryotic-like serine/threonine-protein kinase
VEDSKTGVTAATDVVELSKGPPRDSVIAGKYRVESTLGFGGMGVVLAARHLQLDERVAIKVLRDDVHIEPEHVERFIREAQAAVRLKSEHVARIDDVGMLPDGKPYMVMELLEGLDLGRLLQDAGQLASHIAADMILQVCDGLAEAHSIGIVHRDVKPTNLFVTSRRDGTPLVKVLDFGISKAASASDLSLTQTSSVLGTPTYMSPEQMRSARTADARSDIWSLGTVLYELVEGMPPFAATNFAELCVAVATENPRDMVNAPDLQPVLARALAKSPDERYPSIAEFAEALAPHTSDPNQAQRQVNRIFRLLGKTAPSGRDSTPAMVRIRDSASQLPSAALAGQPPAALVGQPSAPLRAQTFAGEEVSTVANASPTIYRAQPSRTWLFAAALALLAVATAVAVILLTGPSQNSAARSSDASIAEATPNGTNPGSSTPTAGSATATAGSALAGSDDASAGAGANPGSANASAGSAVGGSAAAGSDTLGPAAQITGSGSQHTITPPAGPPTPPPVGPPTPPPPHHPPPPHPPIHRPPVHRPPPSTGPATPMAGSAAASHCDPFANPKGCPH